MEKSLVKRKKKDAESIQEEITNDITGLTNYFTAPNIRNKVKHPLFLAQAFYNCVKLYTYFHILILYFRIYDLNCIIIKTFIRIRMKKMLLKI